MKLILRYILRNVLEKKLRLIIVLITVIGIIMLFTLSLGISRLISDSYKKNIVSGSNSKDIYITSINNSFFSIEDVNIDDCLTDIENELRFFAVYSVDNYNAVAEIHGKTFFDELLKDGEFCNNINNKCVVSERFSEDYGLGIGDDIYLKINGKKYS